MLQNCRFSHRRVADAGRGALRVLPLLLLLLLLLLLPFAPPLCRRRRRRRRPGTLGCICGCIRVRFCRVWAQRWRRQEDKLNERRAVRAAIDTLFYPRCFGFCLRVL